MNVAVMSIELFIQKLEELPLRHLAQILAADYFVVHLSHNVDNFRVYIHTAVVYLNRCVPQSMNIVRVDAYITLNREVNVIFHQAIRVNCQQHIAFRVCGNLYHCFDV